MRKWLACALTLSVLVTSAPVAAFAESDTNGYDIFLQGSVVREETLSEEDAAEDIDDRDLINSGETQIPNMSNYYFDLSHFDTSRVKKMREMFANSEFDMKCLDLSGFDTSHVTDMSRMFVYEHTLRDFASESIDLSSFDTSKVTDMQKMFEGCSSLTGLNLNGFVTSGVTSMKEMFKDCISLETV